MDFGKLMKGMRKRQVEKRVEREHAKMLEKNAPEAHRRCREFTDELAKLGFFLAPVINVIGSNRAQGDIRLSEMSLDHWERMVLKKKPCGCLGSEGQTCEKCEPKPEPAGATYTGGQEPAPENAEDGVKEPPAV
jgi:hypothetical protein